MNRTLALFRRQHIADLVIAVLIVVPVVLYIGIGAMLGPLVELLYKFFALPVMLGLLLGLLRAVFYLWRSRQGVSAPASRRLTAGGFALLAAASLAWLAVGYAHESALGSGVRITKAQAVSYIRSCKIDSISQAADGVELVVANPAVMGLNGGNTLLAASSDWSALTAAAQAAGKTCPSPVGVTVSHPAYRWIDETTAKQLLASCAISTIQSYDMYDTNPLNFGKPIGHQTGIAYLDPGTGKELDLTAAAAKELQAAYQQAATSCGTQVLGGVYDSLNR